MGLAGILGEHKGSVAREVMLTLDEWHQMRAMESGELEDGHAADGAAADIQEMTIVPVEEEEPVPDEIPGEHLY
jgi:hypothetical protein